MKVLIISAEVWRDDTNGGNVLSNIFNGSGFEFAQIYCNPGEPQNKLCKNYYQMTDSMMIRSILRKAKPGKVLRYQDYPNDTIVKNEIAEMENKSFYSFFRSYRFEFFYVIRSIIWKCAKWKNSKLETFIREFNPDIIFAPCYASHELLEIDQYVKKIVNVPVISYISDDNYGLRQFRLDPVYWLNRFVLRKNMRKTFKIYDLVYTMTDEQKKEYENALCCKMKILKKSGDFSHIFPKECVNNPIRIIYAGGIYCGRWKTLARIAKELKIINRDSIKIVLDIYTGNQLTTKQRILLDDGINSRVHAAISQKQLAKVYHDSDIALHVESFELKYRLLTRLSFSTKIIDCMASGCAIMAICWNEHAGGSYLRKNDAAICIDSLENLHQELTTLINYPEKILTYANKAIELGKKNHQQEDVRTEFKKDFEYYFKKENSHESITN